MLLLQIHFIDQGTFYKRHFCTIALCCPSHFSLCTDKTARNTNVTDISPSYGGYPNCLWLQEAGHNNNDTGKLFNSHAVENYHLPYAKGFTAFLSRLMAWSM